MTKKFTIRFFFFLAFALLSISVANAQPYDTVTTSVVRITDSIYRVSTGTNGWARNSINGVVFRKNSLVTYQDTQYVAYYDSASRVVLGKRKTGEAKWILNVTQHTGNTSDAHNSISIIIDGNGVLHISWDHHGHPLRYAKGVAPGSLTVGPKIAMTGLNETNITYPEFFTMPNGDLMFFYRDGASGNGNTVLNRYNKTTQTWSQVQSNLISGENTRNAYIQSTVDATGNIHVSWVWRETSNVASNHDMNYAVSYDGGVTWKTSTGANYTLPITLATAEKIATIPQNSDLINQTSMTTDEDGRPYIATYWKEVTGTAPQYHLIYKTATGWVVNNLGFRTQNFSLAGTGTQVIPIARPQILAWKRGSYVKTMLVFRDAERNKRISLATNDSLGTAGWRLLDAGTDSIGDWEPSFDTELWRTQKKINVFGQFMLQGPNETTTTTAPQQVYVLQIDTAVRGNVKAVFADTIPVVADGRWNGTLQQGGLSYLPNLASDPTSLTGTLNFNNATPIATGVTDVTGGGKVSISTNTAEYYIPKVISPTTTGQRGQLLAFTNPAFTCQADSVLQMRQSNAARANKFSVYGLNSSATIDFKFQLEFNTVSINSPAMYALSFGREATSFSPTAADIYNNPTNGQIFSTLQWNLTATGDISLSYRSGATGYSPISSLGTDQTAASYFVPFTFVKGQVYNMSVWAANFSTAQYQYYKVNGVEYRVERGRYDVWVNSQKIASGVPSLRTAAGGTNGLPTGTTGISINSFAFEGITVGGSTDEYIKVRNILWESVQNNATLPVTWLSFNAIKQDKSVILNWSTASEINTKSFTLERSTNGVDFFAIATMNAAGNSSTVNKYNYTDVLPLSGINYYRIKQTDADGKFGYSKIIAVLFSNKTALITVYPMLVTNGLVSIGFTDQMKDVKLSLFDINGKLLQIVNVGESQNGQVIQLEVNGLAAGMYFIRIHFNKGMQVKKILVE